MEIAELASKDTLKLPGEIAARLRPFERFIIWMEGDTLCLKRMHPVSMTEVVAQAPEGEPLSILSWRAGRTCAQRGIDWDRLSEEARLRLVDDLLHEE